MSAAPVAWHERSLTAVAAALRRGEVSSRQLTEHMLARIAEREPTSRAFVRVLADSALADADRADRARADGAPLGALHGVPIAIKDLLETKGVPTSCGTTVLANWRPTHDATVVVRLRAAGAVILGKTKLTEGAYGKHHPSVAPPINPVRADLSPGVSSSGSGVAVADRLCFAALGTDTGGSIRFPSSYNGIVGLKPTYGRVSRHGCFPLADSLDHIGPMARSVSDAAILFGAIAGFDPADPTCVDVAPVAIAAALAAPLTGLRIGLDRDYASGGVDAQVVASIEDAARRLAAVGVDIVPCRLADTSVLVRGWAFTTSVEAALAHAATYPGRRRDYGPYLAALLDLGGRVSAAQYASLERAREQFRAALDVMLANAGLDALLCPVTPQPPLTIDAFDRTTPDDGNVASFLQFTAPFNYSGHPSLTLPAGRTADARPLAIQLIGCRFGEASLVRAGRAWERAIATP